MTTIESAARTIRVPGAEYELDEAQLAAISFLARYSGRTLEAYRHDLRGFFQWATDHGGLDHSELGVFLLTAEQYDRDHAALAVLLGLNGLRASEACGTNIEDLGFEPWPSHAADRGQGQQARHRAARSQDSTHDRLGRW